MCGKIKSFVSIISGWRESVYKHRLLTSLKNDSCSWLFPTATCNVPLCCQQIVTTVIPNFLKQFAFYIPLFAASRDDMTFHESMILLPMPIEETWVPLCKTSLPISRTGGVSGGGKEACRVVCLVKVSLRSFYLQYVKRYPLSTLDSYRKKFTCVLHFYYGNNKCHEER